MGLYVREVDPDEFPSVSELGRPPRCRRCHDTRVINARTAPEACPDCVDPDQMSIDDLEPEYHQDFSPDWDQLPFSMEDFVPDWFRDAEGHDDDHPF